MDLLWTLLLLGIGYFVYNWYTRIQSEAKEERSKDPRLEGQPPMADVPPTPQTNEDTDYIDYEEVKD